ncbi:MAG TPA: tyrosine-protein phosphatase [Candidatus Dormibacteraeota bacterium]|nr:tyrosine-protein phosphatase [Candidatus Dormibacteraeota bacterium]
MQQQVPSRRLDWPACANTRDLGGLQRPGGFTRSRVLIRSDHVGHLTEAGREALGAYGVTTVIDLRSPAETLSAPNPFADGSGPNYLHIPVVDDANMRKLGDATDMFGRYLMMLNNRPEAFRAIFTALAEAEGGVVFHCFAGKDRTGLVAAMLLEMAGVLPDDIAADFGETDIQLAEKYALWIAESAPERRAAMRDELRCPPERILGVLDHLRQRWGGVGGYLESSGVEPANIDRLTATLA